MDQERIEILFSRLLTGEATLAEQKQLEMAFRADPSLRETWNALKALKEVPPGALSPEDEQKMLERGLKRLELTRQDRPVLLVATREGKELATGKRQKEPAGRPLEIEEVPVPGQREIIRLRRRRMMAAASILVLVIGGAVLYSGHKHKIVPAAIPAVAKELVSKYGSRSFIELPDGSKLWMNAGSRVQYMSPFSDGNRELTLSGEAYFDVKHDPAHPFVIHTGKLDVRVLGTTLNVRAYPDDSLTETTLIKGKVEVEFTNHTHTAVLLQPSEKLIVTTGTNHPEPLVITNASPSATPAAVVKAQVVPKVVTAPIVPDSTDGTIEETSWVENKLVFRKEPFAQLALKLERWYNVRIRFDNDKYRMDELTGTFKDQRIDEVMRALQLTSSFHYRILGDTIHIW